MVIFALVWGSAIWANAIDSPTIAAILVALLGALFGSGCDRIFWSGFCLIAAIYMVLSLGPSPINIQDKLVTSQLLESVSPVLARIHAARHVEPGFKLY